MLCVYIAYIITIRAVQFYPFASEAYDPTFDKYNKVLPSKKARSAEKHIESMENHNDNFESVENNVDDNIDNLDSDDSEDTLSDESDLQENIVNFANTIKGEIERRKKMLTDNSFGQKYDASKKLNDIDKSDKVDASEGKKVSLFAVSKQPIRSITEGKINTSQEHLNSILHRELGDVSADVSKKVEQAIGNASRATPHNFKEVIIIKKRILSDGKRKIVNLNVQEKLVPKIVRNDMRDFGTRAFIGGLLFLLAGLIFTTTIKTYQNWIKRKYIKKNESNVKY